MFQFTRIFCLIVTVLVTSVDAVTSQEKVMFRNGVDANYWLYLVTDEYDSADESIVAWKGGNIPRKWYEGDKEIDPFDFLHEKGVNAFRLRLWVSENRESGLKYATAIARKAQKSGLKPYLVLFN
jgi:arabinogalactan endo-1,4-beta-galactosidase